MIAALLAAVSLAQAAAAPQDPQALIAFADAFDRAQLAKDGPALERMTAEGLVFIDGSGKRQGKREFIAGWTGPDETYEPIVLVDRTITELGPDVGVVSAETTLKGTSGGKAFSSRFRFTDTFHQQGGQWRAVHIQVTRIP
jgi:ketosteroid isomerase-like protein